MQQTVSLLTATGPSLDYLTWDVMKKTKSENILAEQRKSKVGYKQPPEEHQFKPGESGNPKGPPIRRINLWLWFCKYMALTDTELEKLDTKDLTQAQQTALRLVKNMKEGKYSGSERLARYVIDRDEGKATKHVVVEDDRAMSEEEFERCREIIHRNMEISELLRDKDVKEFIEKKLKEKGNN